MSTMLTGVPNSDILEMSNKSEVTEMGYWYTHPKGCEWCASDFGMYTKADVLKYKANHGTFNLCNSCINSYAQKRGFLAASRVGWFPNL